jgi:hypothetical protein
VILWNYVHIFIQVTFVLSSLLEEEQDLDRLEYTDINDNLEDGSASVQPTICLLNIHVTQWLSGFRILHNAWK